MTCGNNNYVAGLDLPGDSTIHSTIESALDSTMHSTINSASLIKPTHGWVRNGLGAWIVVLVLGVTLTIVLTAVLTLSMVLDVALRAFILFYGVTGGTVFWWYRERKFTV